MKTLIYLLLFICLCSCTNNDKLICDGTWKLVTIAKEPQDKYLVEYNNELKKTPEYYQFSINGEIIKNNYQFYSSYKILGNDIYFVNKFDNGKNPAKIIELTDNNLTYEFKDSARTIKWKYVKTKYRKRDLSDSVLYNLSKICDLGQEDSTGTGQIFFNFSAERLDTKSVKFIYDDPYKIEPKLKGSIDKTLNLLPQKEDLNKYSSFNFCLYNYYKWETISLIIEMQNDFKRQYEDKDKLYLNSRIWITKK